MNEFDDNFGNERTADFMPPDGLRENASPMTVDELRERFSNLNSQVALFKENNEIVPLRAVSAEEETDDFENEVKRRQIQEARRDLLQALLVEKERFAKVFQTQKGSYYFVLPSGESFRFKSSNGHDVEPLEIFDDIVFISSEGHRAAIETMTRSNGKAGDERLDLARLIDLPIQSSEFKVGAVPVELNAGGLNGVVLEEYKGKVVIRCKGNILTTLIHFGHPISEIIK